MRIPLICVSIFLMVGCSRHTGPALPSPSGLFVAVAEISGSEAGPTRRDCVRLRITDSKTKSVFDYQTGASDFQKWALAWAPGDSLVLYSSDIGIVSYDIKSGRIIERAPTPAEEEIGRRAYEQKYGNQPRG